jgi:ATP-dependent 26S proteasome regulatory subunit
MASANHQGQPGAGRNQLSTVLLDPKKPAEVRAKVLLDVLHSNEEPNLQQAVVTDLLRQVAARDPETQVLQMMEHYEQALAELEHGPVRPATFLAEAPDGPPSPLPRAHVVTPDGQERFPAIHGRVPVRDLRPGMTVYLDSRGAVLLSATTTVPRVGQEGTFLRQVRDTTLVEAVLQNERLMLYAAAPVLDAIAAGKLKNGDRVLLCPRRQVAFGVVPPEHDYEFRFVDRSRVPEVEIERDIGRPHWILDHMLRRLRILLFRPDLLQRFDLRPRFSALLTGPSGCGKTLTICAFLSVFQKLLAKHTGRKDLGSRVVRVKVAELLSEWLGKTDKNIEELFNDIQAIAATEVETTRGNRVQLPVVVILEEVEGLARRRGGNDAAVYDRILTTLLQRLDGPTDDLGKLPLFVLSTSNRPDLIDSAMARRLGVQARFTRLDREGLAAVLDKKLKPHYPYAPVAGIAAGEVRGKIIEQVTTWLFGKGEGAETMVEIALRDGRKVMKRRRDFLTGSVVDQAIARAIDQAVSTAAENGALDAGLTAEVVIEALRQHIDSLADTVTADNAADYLDLPENAEIETLRRLRSSKGQLPFYLTDLTN